MKTDFQLQQEIFNEFRKEPLLETFRPGIDVKNGVITLFGEVDCYAKKIAAENIVKKVGEVKVIIQEIKVNVPREDRITDIEITQIVLNVLNWNSNIPDSRIDVDVQNGWVTLTGELDWQFQKEAALVAVQDIIGLKGVSDLLTIRKGVYLPVEENKDHCPAIPGVERVESQTSFSSFCSKMFGKISCFFEPEEVEVTFKEAFGRKVRYTYTKANLKELYITHRS